MTHIDHSEKVLIMKVFLSVIILIIILQSWTKADDIRDFEIEGITLYDSALKYYNIKTLKEDVLKGYKIGADDYLTKPFDSEILLAKIKSLFSRKNLLKSDNSTVYEFNFGEFNFNSKLRMLNHGSDEPIKLSPKENELLKMLVLNLNDLLPRDIALNKIWRDDNYFTSRSMDVYIAKLRKYLETDNKIKIINIHGEGFRLTVDN